MVSHPYSIYIWQPAHSPSGVGNWNEPVHCFTEQWAVYVAGLMHQDSRSVIKVVRYGLNIQCFPDEHAVELVEKQIGLLGPLAKFTTLSLKRDAASGSIDFTGAVLVENYL
jgi:hypothetical protein